jgi:hypothetical protein
MSRRPASTSVFRVRILGGFYAPPPQYPDLDDEDDWDEDLLSQFPPVELAPLPQLQAAAAAAPTVRRLRALVEWLGAGRKLTAAGNLTLTDGKELARLLGLADPDRLAGPRAERTGHRWPGASGRLGQIAAPGPRPQRAACGGQAAPPPAGRAAGAVCSGCRRPAPGGTGLPLTSMVDSPFPHGPAEALLDLLSLLYGAEKPVTVGGLTGHFWEDHGEAVLDGQAASRLELLRLAMAVEAAQYLGLLRELGMVDLGGGSGADPAVVAVNPQATGSADAYLCSLSELTVRLIPLGTWWTNLLLRQAGAVAPVIGELASADAARLIEGVSAMASGLSERSCGPGAANVAPEPRGSWPATCGALPTSSSACWRSSASARRGPPPRRRSGPCWPTRSCGPLPGSGWSAGPVGSCGIR